MIEVRITLNDVDYSQIVDYAIPLITGKLAEKKPDSKTVALLRGLRGLPGGVAKLMLSALPQETKDDMAACFIEAYQQELCETVNTFAESKGLAVSVNQIEVRNIEKDTDQS